MQHERGHRRIHLSRTTPSIPWIHYFCSDFICKKSDSLLFEFIQLRPPKNGIQALFLSLFKFQKLNSIILAYSTSENIKLILLSKYEVTATLKTQKFHQ